MTRRHVSRVARHYADRALRRAVRAEVECSRLRAVLATKEDELDAQRVYVDYLESRLRPGSPWEVS